jgi:hypothetical protein
MTMPTIEKTWQYSIAYKTIIALVTNASTENKVTLLNIKKALCSFANNPWTVTGSSNSTAAGMDAVDRWPTYLQGTNTSASVNTSGGNNVIRVRSNGTYGSFQAFSVTSGASVNKTTIVSDLNNVSTGFPSNPVTANLVASITGTNQLTISDSSANSAIEIDSIANGSTLGTPCEFTSGGMNTWSNLTWNSAGSEHSWIVLKQTGIHSNFEICIDCSNTSTHYITVVMGVSGFSGGSTTACPTATTQQILHSNAYWLAADTATAGWPSIIVAMQSTDGQCTRIVAISNGWPVLFWFFEKPKNPVSGWTNPAIGCSSSAGGYSSAMSLSRFNDTARAYSYMNGVWASLFLTCEGASSSTIMEWDQISQRNQLSLEYPIWPIGLVSDTVSAKGRHGQLYDMWWGQQYPVIGGGFIDTSYPDDSSYLYWQCDDFVFPWNGTKPVMRL